MFFPTSQFALFVRKETILQICRNASYFSKFFKKAEKSNGEGGSGVKTTLPLSELRNKQIFKLIYSNKEVKYLASFLKLKKPLIIVTFTVTPALYLADNSGGLSAKFLFLSLNQILIMSILEYLFKNVVGAIYVNETNEDEVVISFMGKNGKRINSLHNFKDVVCYGFKNNMQKFTGFADVSICGSNIVYKLNVRNFNLHDKNKFLSLLGDVKSLQ